MVCVARQTNTFLKPKRLLLLSTDAKALVQLESVLARDSNKAWRTATGDIEALPNRPFTVSVVKQADALLSGMRQQQIATKFCFLSYIKQNSCDESSAYTESGLLPDSANLVHQQPHVYRLQQIANY